MPAVVVSKVLKEGGISLLFGSMSCGPNDSFHDFRQKLEVSGTFKFPFQFIDSLTGSRMPIPWEAMNCVHDYGTSIQVIPNFQSSLDIPETLSSDHVQPNLSTPELGSSHASNDQSFSTELNSDERVF